MQCDLKNLADFGLYRNIWHTKLMVDLEIFVIAKNSFSMKEMNDYFRS